MKFCFPLFCLFQREAPKALSVTKRFAPMEAFFDDLFPLCYFLDFPSRCSAGETYTGNEK